MTGSIEPLLQALAGAGVRHLVSREPSLEELFLAHYSGDGAMARSDRVVLATHRAPRRAAAASSGASSSAS